MNFPTGVDYARKEYCVLCGATNLEILIEFPKTPIANQLLIGGTGEAIQTFYPLTLGICLDCRHIQLLSMINPKLLFSNYPYFSNINQGTSTRFKELAENLDSKYAQRQPNEAKKWTEREQFVLEIGSNDGYLLGLFKERGYKVLGVDPASEVTKVAVENGIDTITDFFSMELARRIVENYPTPNLIVANNVLAHTDDLWQIFTGISEIMGEETVMSMEFSYVLDVYEKLLFDTIYHEHTSYHSIKPLQNFLNRHGLEIFRVERFSAHGGSARILISRIESKYKIEPSVQEAINAEDASGIHESRAWSIYSKRIEQLRLDLNREVQDLLATGKSIAGYGVPAKFTTLFHVLGLQENYFKYLLDDTPAKIGKYAPGTHIEITSVKELSPGSFDYALIFSWNYTTEILAKLKNSQLGLTGAIIPLPTVSLIHF
jgi:SAM-dependent methyltransferase